MNLAWKIALVHKSLAHLSLLSTYETERLPTIAEMLNKTTELHKNAFHHTPSSSALASGASVADPKAAQDPMFRPATGSQLGVNYRWSPLAIDGRALALGGTDTDEEKNPYGRIGDKVRAGDRAPDAPNLREVSTGTDQQTTLHRVVAGCDRHHIIVFTDADHVASESESLAAFDKYVSSGVASTSIVLASGTSPGSLSSASGQNRGVRVFVDEAGHAYNGYDVERENGKTVYVVIRPDGMIGAYAVEVEQVELYFQKIVNGV